MKLTEKPLLTGGGFRSSLDRRASKRFAVVEMLLSIVGFKLLVMLSRDEAAYCKLMLMSGSRW